MAGLTLSLPIAAGKVEAWRRFCQELSGGRRQAHADSRQRMGITRERLSLLESPFGSVAVTTLEALDVNTALAHMIGSQLPFEIWFRERLQDLHGVNLTRYQQYKASTPEEPQELLFEWNQPVSPRNGQSYA